MQAYSVSATFSKYQAILKYARWGCRCMKIENQDMAMPHMGQHVRMTVAPTTEKEREQEIRIMELYDQAP